MRKFSLAVAVAVVGFGLSALAQQNGTYKVKHSPPEKAAKSAPLAKPSSAGTASAATSKELQSVERQTAKSSASSRSAGRSAGAPNKLKPIKDKPNPPIDFAGTGGGKKAGMVNQSPNPYKGRLKQKHAQ
jgi:hypothetical protein